LTYVISLLKLAIEPGIHPKYSLYWQWVPKKAVTMMIAKMFEVLGLTWAELGAKNIIAFMTFLVKGFSRHLFFFWVYFRISIQPRDSFFFIFITHGVSKY
jgi:hypothetical protein